MIIIHTHTHTCTYIHMHINITHIHAYNHTKWGPEIARKTCEEKTGKAHLCTKQTSHKITSGIKKCINLAKLKLTLS